MSSTRLIYTEVMSKLVQSLQSSSLTTPSLSLVPQILLSLLARLLTLEFCMIAPISNSSQQLWVKMTQLLPTIRCQRRNGLRNLLVSSRSLMMPLIGRSLLKSLEWSLLEMSRRNRILLLVSLVRINSNMMHHSRHKVLLIRLVQIKSLWSQLPTRKLPRIFIKTELKFLIKFRLLVELAVTYSLQLSKS
jgi:hypothetical protein